MSGTIRDLVVGIDFSDIDVRELLRVDSALDEVEDQLRSMGIEINDVAGEFGEMGGEALLAANVAERALQGLEDQAEDTSRAVHGIGNAFSLASLKALGLGAAWTAVAAGAVAVAAPLLLVVGGLASSFAAAGAGVAAFGAVAVPTITKLFETSANLDKLQKKVNDADNAKQRAKAQKELAGAYAAMSKEQRFALKELQSFKSFFGKFAKQFESPVFNAFGTTLHMLKELFKGLGPTITNVSGAINKILETMDQDISNGGLKGFFDWLEKNAAGSITNFATVFGNVFSGVFSLIQAFAPVGAQMEQGLVSLSEKFSTWAAGFGESNGFKKFIDYAQTNGPVLLDTLGNLWDIIKKLITDLAPLGTVVLSALEDITSEISDNWPAIRETIISVGAAVGSFVLIMNGLKVIGLITTLIKAWRAGTLLATAAQLGLNLAMWASPITWVVAGIAALIGIGILLYRNWDIVKAKTTALWDKLGAFKGVATLVLGPLGLIIRTAVIMAKNWDSTKGVWENVWNGIKLSAASAVNDVIGSINKLIGMINKIPGVSIPIIPKVDWGKAKGVTENPNTKIALTGKTSGGHAISSHATGLESVPYDNYMANLHKGEAVLTAKQSNALRAAGILSKAGNKPKLSMGDQVAPTGKMKTGSTVFAPNVHIELKGVTGDAKDIGKQVSKETGKQLEKLFTNLGFAFE